MARFGAGMNRRDLLLIAAALLTACSKSSQKIRLALNWKPEPDFGGFYAAPYQKYGLDVEILPGGAGTPTIQMVGAGSAEFGIVSADELVVARSRGNDVVAMFAMFQNNPQGIMVHAARKLASIGDIFRRPGTVAMQRGLSYARLLEKMYGFDTVKIVPSPNGDVSAFLHDKNFAQQCFITSEPLIANRQGADVQVFPISDIGFNPYTDVMATSGELLRSKPEMVKPMVAAVREGLRIYLDDPKPTNVHMEQLNPTMPLDLFTETSEVQKPLIETEETRRNGLGVMTKERWETLIKQLRDLGDIEKAPTAEECFRSL
jgi:NitT/TauT family transport system substrate-binding protein